MKAISLCIEIRNMLQLLSGQMIMTIYLRSSGPKKDPDPHVTPQHQQKSPRSFSHFGFGPGESQWQCQNRLGQSIPVIADQPNPYYVRTYVRIACSCCRVRRYVFCRSVLYPFKDILLSRVPMSRSQHQGRHAVVVRQVQRGLVHAPCDSQRSVLP